MHFLEASSVEYVVLVMCIHQHNSKKSKHWQWTQEIQNWTEDGSRKVKVFQEFINKKWEDVNKVKINTILNITSNYVQ